MSGEAPRKVVPITEAKGYGAAQGSHGRELGKSAEVVPVNFRRQDLVKLVQGSPIMFAYIPSEDEGALDLIITIPEWVFELVASVGVRKAPAQPGGSVV